MSNHTQPFHERLKNNDAENHFIHFCQKENLTFYEYGIHNHGFGGKFAQVSRFIRNTPDFIVFKNFPQFVEVKGGKDYIGLKLTDFESYKQWGNIMPISYFFYSSSYQNIYWVSHDSIVQHVEHCQIDRYNDATQEDKKEYYKIECRDLEELSQIKGGIQWMI